MSALLAVEELSRRFRGLQAVADVSFEVNEGEIVALIGPNGAGKTTVFNLVAGALRPDGGRILFAGRRIDGLRPDLVCRRGIARTFQIARPFGDLTVEDNVAVGALRETATVSAARRRAREVLALVELAPLAARPAHSLTLPERKRLELARALATVPRLLLLDEVMAGLRPAETDRMLETLRRLNAEAGITILLIEHVMRAVMAVADRVLVLDSGRLIAEGEPAEVVRDPAVLACYLGRGAA